MYLNLVFKLNYI